MIRACSRAPRLSTRCVLQTRSDEHIEPTGAKSDPCLLEGATFLHEMRDAQTRWDEHTEATWHRLDRVCSREQDLDFVASLNTSMLDSRYRGVKSLSLLTSWLDQPYGGRVESR